MTEQVKMSDVFMLPLHAVDYQNGIEDSFCDEIIFADMHHAEKESLCIAINSYDQHVDLIAKQAWQIKMLREALGGLVEIGLGEFHDGYDVITMNKAIEALSATEKK